VQGDAQTGSGVIGISQKWVGVYGETRGDRSVGPSGVLGDGKDGGVGVKGHANGEGIAAVAGYHLSNRGPGVFGKGSPAGFFEGNVEITGNLTIQSVSIQTWLHRIVALEQKIMSIPADLSQVNQEISQLKQNDTAMQNQLNTAVSNLTARVTQLEIQVRALALASHTHSV
jgi:outer membrane murein-binding lipoprotein Lpp